MENCNFSVSILRGSVIHLVHYARSVSLAQSFSYVTMNQQFWSHQQKEKNDV